MDTLIKRGSAGNDGPAAPNGHRFIVGTKQLRKQLERGGVRQVFLAQDADPAITMPLEALCVQKGIECIWVKHMLELGKRCGIDVGAAAAALVAA